MALAPRLDLRQSQSLVMTPQLQQAIKLLALSNLELKPSSQRAGAQSAARGRRRDGAAPPRETVELPEAPSRVAGPDASADMLIGRGAGEADSPLDVDYSAETFIDDGPGDAVNAALSGGGATDWLSGSSGGAGEEALDFDSFAAPDIGLHEHLMQQAGSALSGMALVIAGQLIGPDRRCRLSGGEPAGTGLSAGASLAQVEAVLASSTPSIRRGRARAAFPSALRSRRRTPTATTRPWLASSRISTCWRAASLPICAVSAGVDEEDMADMIRELRCYDPKPGLKFGGERPAAVTPDVFVMPSGKGWAIEINGATLPRVLVNRRYHSQLAGGARDKTSKAWLSDCLASANWLVKALDQRQRTILKVTEEIVRRQEAFFHHGVTQLRPLTLKAVADEVGLHESTISRVTSNKYLGCPRGTFELKYFFNVRDPVVGRWRGGLGRGGQEPYQGADRRGESPTRSSPTTRWSICCASAVSTSRGARWPNIARRSGWVRRCKGGGKRR